MRWRRGSTGDEVPVFITPPSSNLFNAQHLILALWNQGKKKNSCESSPFSDHTS
jgi:hypothetical protein